MIHLVTYHSNDMSISALRCKESALKHGFDKVYQWTRPALEQTEFFEQNKELLSQPRGDGFWAWKPFVIMEALKACAKEDIIIYSDVGVEFIAPISQITRQMGDIWLFGNMYQHLHWCKADAFIPILSNQYYGYQGKQCQASVMMFRKGAIPFVQKWLDSCTVPEWINDESSRLPNDPEFQEHRHDQALLTCWAIRENVPLHWWPAMYNNGAFIYPKDGYSDNYPVLFYHHRKRNDEYA